MDAQQRKQLGTQIRNAREAAGLSQARLAEIADMAPNTVGALENGKPVQAETVGKVMAALGIEPAAEVARRQGMPSDVHLVTEVIGLWLYGMDEADRPAAVLDLMRYLGHLK